MYPTNNISIFIEKNDSEFRYLVISICDDLNYPGEREDLIQDLYLKFLTSEVIQVYNFDRYKTKMSTWLYPVIRNFILSKINGPEFKLPRFYSPDYGEISNDIDDIDLIITRNPVALIYKHILINNEELENPVGIASELKDWEEKFKDSDKNKRYLRNKNKGCTLLDLFHYLYAGFSNKEIAGIYNVSDMSISLMKQQLADILLKQGFNKRFKRNNDKVKMSKMPV
jgi:DNA-directed RNA polymerase specialized sigma24 family protein